MTADRGDQPFPGISDDAFPVGDKEGNRAYFGRDVLRGLVDGIDDFARARQARWWRPGSRTIGPALLGCSPWINDNALLAVVEKLKGACILVSKQPRTPDESLALRRLHAFNGRTRGLQLRALVGLGDMAPKVDGEPLIAGPYTPINDHFTLSTIRTVGYRRTGRMFPPIAHAKLALLGYLWWHDEDEFGPAEILGFKPRRLWVSSANFTFNSRRSLEFGYWTEEPALVEGAERFLVQLIGASEELDPDADIPDPDLAPIEFDGVAMAEAAAEMSWDDHEEDEP